MTSERPGFEPGGDDVTAPYGAPPSDSGITGASLPPPENGDRPPEPPPGAPAPSWWPPDGGSNRLRRTRGRDAMVAGVAGGIARELGVDPLFVRAAFVLLALAGGSGFVLYAAGWLLLPDEGGHEPIGAGLARRHGHRPWLLVALAFVAFASDGWDRRGWGHPGLWLVILGLFVLARHRGSRHGGSDGTDARRPQAGLPVSDDTASWPWDDPSLAAPSVPRARSLVPRVLLVLLALAAADLVAFAAHLPALSVSAVLALGLAMTGGALVLGVRRDRWGGLLALGVVLMVALATATAAQAALAGGVGTRVFHLTDPAGVAPIFRLGAGDLTLDLVDLHSPTPVTVSGRVAAGHLAVVVPAGMALSVEARSGIGQVDVLGTVHHGVDVDQQVNLPGSAGAGTLHLDLAAGVGDIEVRSAA